MIESSKHFPINWVDGMKVNKTHFLATQNYASQLARESIGIQLSPISYGLLPTASADDSVSMSLVIDNHKLLRVKLEQCHAVTPNGCRIEITKKHQHSYSLEEAYPEAEFQLKTEGQSEVVLLANVSINPHEQIPFGEPDPEENPPRYPYLYPTYKLSLVPEQKVMGQINNPYELTIGKIIITATETYLLDDYIPPCVAVSSHKHLLTVYNKIDKFLGEIELYAVQIAQKINRKNQNDQLSILILNLCECILDYAGREITSFRWHAMHSPPAYMFDKIISLARLMKNFIDAKSGAGKEDVFNYFAEWCSVSQGGFEILFTEVVNIGYVHTKIDETAEAVVNFMRVMTDLFSALNRLDFIGKRKDTGIFIKEKEDVHASRARRNRTFLLD